MPRVTITKKANGRYYLGMDEAAARALTVMVRGAVASRWEMDCMGAVQGAKIIDGGERVFGAVKSLEAMLPEGK